MRHCPILSFLYRNASHANGTVRYGGTLHSMHWGTVNRDLKCALKRCRWVRSFSPERASSCACPSPELHERVLAHLEEGIRFNTHTFGNVSLFTIRKGRVRTAYLREVTISLFAMIRVVLAAWNTFLCCTEGVLLWCRACSIYERVPRFHWYTSRYKLCRKNS